MAASMLFGSLNEVHVWKYKLNVQQDQAELSTILSDEERKQCRRYLFRENRARYALVHVFLRNVLAHYLGIPAEEIQFGAEPYKKPFIIYPSASSLHFSLSYRDEYALLAISQCEVIGVDVEKVKDVGNISLFSFQYFSEEERRKVLENKNTSSRLLTLFMFWTMKEALIKALGSGFSSSLSRYNLCPFLHQPEVTPEFDPTNTWHIRPITISDDYRSACAVRSSQVAFNVFDYAAF